MSTAEAAERLAEIVEAQSELIRRIVNALEQSEEFEKELKKINRLKEKFKIRPVQGHDCYKVYYS